MPVGGNPCVAPGAAGDANAARKALAGSGRGVCCRHIRTGNRVSNARNLDHSRVYAMNRRFVLGLVCVFAPATHALAHGGHGHAEKTPGWTWDPWITVPLLVAVLMFAIGWIR